MTKNLLTFAAVLLTTTAAFSTGPSFRPDARFTGSMTQSLPRFSIVWPVVDKGFGNDIEHAIVVEVRSRSAPGIIKIVQSLLPKSWSDLLLIAYLQ